MPGGIQSMGSQRVRRDCVTKHRFVISFLPKSKHLLALWPGSLSTLILEPKKIKSVTVSIFFLIWLLVNGGLTGDSLVIPSLL